VKGPPLLLDTNVASYIFAGSPLGRRYEALVHEWDPHVSLMTIAEMHIGAYIRGWGSQRLVELHRLLHSMDILFPTQEIAHQVARLSASRQAMGRQMSVNDAWIAATALVCGCPLVTHDQDFLGIEGLYILTELRPRDDNRVSTAAARAYPPLDHLTRPTILTLH